MKKLFASLILAKKSNLGLYIRKYLIFVVKDFFIQFSGNFHSSYISKYRMNVITINLINKYSK